MRRAWPSWLFVLGLATFVFLRIAPSFEIGLVTLVVGACAALPSDARERRIAARLGTFERLLVVHAPLAVLGAWVTAPSWAAPSPFVGLDGHVNLAIVGEIVDQARLGRPLLWLNRFTPGDPTLDLYPTLAHRVVAWVAIASGHEHELARVLVAFVSAAYVAVPVGIARIALRIGAPAPAALAVGAFALLDLGSDFSWGTRGVFHYGYFPSTVGVALSVHALAGVLEILERPRRTSAIVAAGTFALAAAMHPLSLVLSLAIAASISIELVLAPRTTRSRWLAPWLATVVGTLGSAWHWLPFAERVVNYGVHYGTPQIPWDLALARMLFGRLPDGGWSAVTSLGWLAAFVALALRRPLRGERVVAWLACLLVASYVDVAFLELPLAPTASSVRWQAFRIGSAVKPFLYALGALALGAAARAPSEAIARLVKKLGGSKTTSDRAERFVRVTAVAATALACALAGPRWGRALVELEAHRLADMTAHEVASAADLAALRTDIESRRGNDPHGRLLLSCGLVCPPEVYALARDPGIPTALTQAAPAGILLRDQFRTTSPENLARFGMRWAVAAEESRALGDPRTERRFGRLIVRDLSPDPASIARVIRGEGRVLATRLAGEGYELRLDGTSSPALVELGTPYYPRLVATHESGATSPVHALPVREAEPDEPNPSIEHAVALWLRPGRTTVRAIGRLPSDDDGRWLACLALAAGAAVLAEPVRHRLRAAAMYVLAARWLTATFFASILVSAATWIVMVRSRPIDSVRFGILWPRPRVFVSTRDGSHECEAVRFGRSYACPDGARLAMVVGYDIRAWHVGWPVPAPAIEIRDATPRHRYVIELPGQVLEGSYLAHCAGCEATLRDPATMDGRARFGEETTRFSSSVEAPVIEVRPLRSTATLTVLASRFVDPAVSHPSAPPVPP